ncbi:hypothetical protein B5E77_16195 [Lachnoclostridium sp. An131]|uniref:acyltransferase family protein n=1 Tax=Lachnoclostridium sp. An131 TaxID=1965555 RepID=UPI000B3A5DF7|nr:acyltransferase family protein [Lachnoclostridium sp. An131]OUQ23006.1 hypothetical protein B5E77_16195 [Lachnoclostridium sp. An131]
MIISKKRIAWLDIAKVIGIFAIYLGHLGESAGLSYNFVFQFHVPLFFFLAGCTDNFNRETGLLNNFLKNINALLIPTYFYAVLSLFVYVIRNNSQMVDVKPFIGMIMKGLIRNTFFASSLWFLTCLFAVKILGMLIQRLKYKWLMLIIGFGMYYVAETLIAPNPIITPHWYYNFDSAFYYAHYFITGFVVYPYIEKLFMADRFWKKVIIIGTGILTFIYSAYLYWGLDIIGSHSSNKWLLPVAPLYKAYLIIIFVIVLSYFLQKVEYLAVLGRNTLYLCGNEYMIKEIVPACLGLLGLGINVDSPLSAYVYTSLLLIVTNYVLVPLERPLLDSIKEKFTVFWSRFYSG